MLVLTFIGLKPTKENKNERGREIEQTSIPHIQNEPETPHPGGHNRRR